MFRVLSVVLLLSLLAFTPGGSLGAQSVSRGASHETAQRRTAQENESAVQDRMTQKQAGVARRSLAQQTRDVAAAATWTAPDQSQTRTQRGRLFMIVGGAAFLAGLIIGDDAGTAIAIGGAGLGLYGLYLWAQ